MLYHKMLFRLSRTPLFSYAGGWQETVRDDMSDRGRSPSLEASSTGGWNPETISCAQGLLATDADAAAALEVSATAVQDPDRLPLEAFNSLSPLRII